MKQLRLNRNQKQSPIPTTLSSEMHSTSYVLFSPCKRLCFLLSLLFFVFIYLFAFLYLTSPDNTHAFPLTYRQIAICLSERMWGYSLSNQFNWFWYFTVSSRTKKERLSRTTAALFLGISSWLLSPPWSRAVMAIVRSHRISDHLNFVLAIPPGPSCFFLSCLCKNARILKGSDVNSRSLLLTYSTKVTWRFQLPESSGEDFPIPYVLSCISDS